MQRWWRDYCPRLLDELGAFRAEMEAIDWQENNALKDDRRKFILLLSGLSSCRIAPGIPRNMGHDALSKCTRKKDRSELRGHLESIFGITDEASLWRSLDEFYRSYDEYDTFRTFWANRPEFDINTLNEEGREVFESSMHFAEKLRGIVGNNGFLAWDVNERIGMCRRAYAAGIITEKRFREAADSMAFRVAAYYDNWGEYALSCVCGAVYYAYRVMYDNDETETAAAPFVGIQMDFARALTAQDGIWREYGWPKYGTDKKFAIAAKDMILMIPDWDGPKGCIATDRITVDGAKVGYMRRDEPVNNEDSGWQFTAGDESDEYMDNPENSGIYELNTICNSDPDIIGFLNANVGSAFERRNGGLLRPVN